MKSNWKANFFVLWSGQAVSMITSAMVQMAVVYTITERGGTSQDLSLALLIGFLPYALFGPFIGVFVDRYDRKKIMIASDLLIASAGVMIPLNGQTKPVSLLMIYGVLLVRSIGQAFYAPSLSAITPLIIPKQHLTQYSGYSQSLESISYIISPVLAMIVYQYGRLNAVILLDVMGALFASFTVFLSYIPSLKPTIVNVSSTMLIEFKEGFKALLKHKELVTLLLFGSMYIVVFMPISALFPLMSTQHFYGGNQEITIVEIVFALGMLCGGLGLSKLGNRMNRAMVLCSSIMICGLTLLLSGLLPKQGYALFVGLCFVMGFSMPFYAGLHSVFFQEKLPAEVLGRVFSLVGAITTLATPLGLGISALFADEVGIGKWFAYSGIIVIGIGICMLINKDIKKLDTNNQS
ncbi:MFS transporter [Erysipelothrix larvae]|uniref:MFS transporter n=1 Tax=Erysipelothrix larvae TaxID=1514105 RepID=A0A109UH30_9FIRM|nr:MFS transporter [Erysipelothrix larvae]AMC93613.1 MFS transporter [Erysipelothrix larvae]